ncbi:MAG: recombinase family protein [Waltera sp.]
MTDAVENQYIEMAYARVSSKNQTLARQEASILNAVPDLKAKYFYKDKWTGKEFDRPEYGRLKEKVEELTEVNPDINLRLTVRYPERRTEKMAQNTTSNRGYDDTVYIPRQQRLRPMILTRKVQQFYLVYLCFPDGSEMQIAAYMMPNDGNWRANDAFYDSLVQIYKKRIRGLS